MYILGPVSRAGMLEAHHSNIRFAQKHGALFGRSITHGMLSLNVGSSSSKVSPEFHLGQTPCPSSGTRVSNLEQFIANVLVKLRTLFIDENTRRVNAW